MRRFAILVACAAICAAASAHAVGLTGDFGTSVLATDRPVDTDEPVTRVPVYHTLRFKAGDLGSEKLSWEGSYRVWYDTYGDAAEGSDWRVLRSYLRWHDGESRLDTRLGRQFVAEGVGRTYLDGFFLKKGTGNVTTSAFVGMPLKRTLTGDESWPDNKAYQWGAHVQLRRSTKLRLSMSYSEMQYDGDTGERLVGAEAVYLLNPRNTFRVRTDVDAAGGNLDRAYGLWIFQQARAQYYTVEVHHRKARVWAFSPLADITPGGFTRVTASHTRPISEDFRLYLAASGLDAGGGLGGTADLGLNWRTVRVGYLFASTAAMMGNGIYVRGTYRVNDKLLLGARTNWTRYEMDQADDASQSIGSAAYATISPTRRLDITAEVHQITNDTYTYQFEGLLSLRWKFSYIPADAE